MQATSLHTVNDWGKEVQNNAKIKYNTNFSIPTGIGSIHLNSRPHAAHMLNYLFPTDLPFPSYMCIRQ